MSALDPPLEGYEVRPMLGANARKPYRCPACHNTIRVGESHVVVWPEGDVEDRRHWHRHCWRVAVSRGRIA